MPDVSWLQTAADDLAGIISYIAERSPQAARDLRQRIDNVVLSLARHPCRYRAGRVSGTRECVVHPNYVVVYRVTASAIEVVNIVHARREYPPLATALAPRCGRLPGIASDARRGMNRLAPPETVPIKRPLFQ